MRTTALASMIMLAGTVSAAIPAVSQGANETAVDPDWLSRATGADLLAESSARHQLSGGLLDQLTMIVTDAAGHRQTRQLRLHRRDAIGGGRHYWLRFDSPADLAGVTLVAERRPQKAISGWLHLPALGTALLPTRLADDVGPLPGSDLRLQDFDLPDFERFRIERRRDRRVDGVQHLIVDLSDPQDSPGSAPRIRLQLLAATLSVVRTSHFNSAGRVTRVRTAHDLRPLEDGGWWPAVIRIDDRRTGRDTLLRVESRRALSEPPDSRFLAAIGTSP